MRFKYLATCRSSAHLYTFKRKATSLDHVFAFIQLSDLDTNLLGRVQSHFHITRRPMYTDMLRDALNRFPLRVFYCDAVSSYGGQRDDD